MNIIKKTLNELIYMYNYFSIRSQNFFLHINAWESQTNYVSKFVNKIKDLQK